MTFVRMNQGVALPDKAAAVPALDFENSAGYLPLIEWIHSWMAVASCLVDYRYHPSLAASFLKLVYY